MLPLFHETPSNDEHRDRVFVVGVNCIVPMAGWLVKAVEVERAESFPTDDLFALTVIPVTPSGAKRKRCCPDLEWPIPELPKQLGS